MLKEFVPGKIFIFYSEKNYIQSFVTVPLYLLQVKLSQYYIFLFPKYVSTVQRDVISCEYSLHSSPCFAWRQTTQSPPLLQFAVNLVPCILSELTAGSISFLHALLKYNAVNVFLRIAVRVISKGAFVARRSFLSQATREKVTSQCCQIKVLSLYNEWS